MAAGRPLSLDARLWMAGALATLVLGCYSPQITDGGYLCATAGKQCPDGFVCDAAKRCVRAGAVVPTTDGGNDAGREAGGEAMCSVPPVTALCAGAPASGDACSPACQTGCACGRCNVVGDAPACVPAGTVQLGEICRPDADNCAPGFICLREICGNGLARCYRHCTDDSQCGSTICTIYINDSSGAQTKYKTCDVPPRACDPIANTGCPDPALNCYLTSANMTLCDCPASPPLGVNGASCAIYSECAPGFVCIANVGKFTDARCHYACNVATPSCPNTTGADGGVGPPAACVPSGAGAKYGYCNI